MDLDTAIKTIEAVLTPEEKATAVQTKTISLGQTEQEVETILGKPDKIINLGQKVTWVYKDIKVIFVDGKVVDIQ
jgi:imidazolonepropionase-like amidohydrolase